MLTCPIKNSSLADMQPSNDGKDCMECYFHIYGYACTMRMHKKRTHPKTFAHTHARTHARTHTHKPVVLCTVLSA